MEKSPFHRPCEIQAPRGSLTPASAWAVYLIASWWGETDLASPAPADPSAVVTALDKNGLPLLTLVHDHRPEAVGFMAEKSFQRALAAEREKLGRQVESFSEIRDRWHKAGIPALFIKALGPQPSFPYKTDNLDILVPEKREDEARKLIRDLDYIELRHLEEPHKFLFRCYHLGKKHFDLHLHGRIEWHVTFLDQKAVWEHSVSAPDTDLARIPSLEDGLLITLAHAVYENKTIRLVDLAKVLYAVHSRSLDWERMMNTVRRRGWLSGFLYGLGLCARLELNLFGTAALLQRIPPNMRGLLPRRQKYKLDKVLSNHIILPYPLPFLISKQLYYLKTMSDSTRSPSARAADIISHTLRGTRQRLGLQSQRPMLIALDGIDGSGKSTQAGLLVEALKSAAIRHRIVWTRGGSSPFLQPFIRIGKRVSGQKRKTESSSPADKELERALHLTHPLARIFWPWLVALETAVSFIWKTAWPLLNGEVVIADRYLLSALIELGARLDRADILQTPPARFLRIVAPRARYCFWLDIPPKIAQDRRGGRESLIFLKKQALLAPRLAAELGAERLDATDSIEALHDRIVVVSMRGYLDSHRTFLNGLFLSNPRPLPGHSFRKPENRKSKC